MLTKYNEVLRGAYGLFQVIQVTEQALTVDENRISIIVSTNRATLFSGSRIHWRSSNAWKTSSKEERNFLRATLVTKRKILHHGTNTATYREKVLRFGTKTVIMRTDLLYKCLKFVLRRRKLLLYSTQTPLRGSHEYNWKKLASAAQRLEVET